MSQLMKSIEAEVTVWPEDMQDAYRALIANGQSPSMSHMLVSRQGPRSLTDDAVMSGMQRIKDLPDGRREYLCQKIKENGGSVSPSDCYMQGMASFTGDPNAVIGHGDCVDKIRRVANERGELSTGIVEVDGRKNREVKPAKKTYELHPRIVERNRQKMIAADPSLAHKDQRELRESIVDKHRYQGE